MLWEIVIGIVIILSLIKYLVVMDLIYRTVQVLRENLYWIRISAQDAGLIEPVELWDKG